jgi:hypothetical protein
MTNRTSLGIGVIVLALVGAGTLVVSNRDLSKNLAEKTQATLFRWGELMSISAELKRQYGAEPDVTYDSSTRDRTLSICFNNYRLPEQETPEGHAREIAAFAIGKTTKSKQIDAVRVLFQSPGSGPYTFALDDLMPNQPHAVE